MNDYPLIFILGVGLGFGVGAVVMRWAYRSPSVELIAQELARVRVELSIAEWAYDCRERQLFQAEAELARERS